MNRLSPFRWFVVACLFEAWLAGAAALVALASGRPWLADFAWSVQALGSGMAAAVPMFGLYLWTMHSQAPVLGTVRGFLETTARPLFEGWHIGQLALLSLLAGIGEEFLFRGAIQGSLAAAIGPVAGLVVASVIFGLCHYINTAYAVVTTLVGIYLGLVWLWTGNLLAPIVTHAAYDFAALLYLMRSRHRR